MLNSLDFSWQHVTYKTLASVWVLFVFYLSWLLLPEVSAIVHGLNNGSGTAGGATINPHPSPGPSSVRATQVTAVAPGATAGGDDLGFSVIGTPYMRMQEICLDFELLRVPSLEHAAERPAAIAENELISNRRHKGDFVPYINNSPFQNSATGSRTSI